MAEIGFVILSHAAPHQLLRLTERIHLSYGADAPIVCHHDFDKAAIPESEFSFLYHRLQFVRPHVFTMWSRFSLVEAFLRALAQLHASASPPRWTVFLSAADYPVQPADRVLEELTNINADAYLDFTALSPNARRPTEAALMQFDSTNLAPGVGPYNEWLFARRYYGVTIHTPGLQRSNRWRPRYINIYYPGLTCYLSPFNSEFRCYAGSQWFTLGTRAVDHLLHAHRSQKRLLSHYRRASTPDESYVHTILCNASHLRIHKGSFRFIDWSNGSGKHPAVLTATDYSRVIESGAHFARKFDPIQSRELLDRLDSKLNHSLSRHP